VCNLYETFFVLYLQYFGKVFDVVSSYCLCCFVLSAFICMLCIFMTYSTSYCCHYKLKDPWNVCMYVCICTYIFSEHCFKYRLQILTKSVFYVTFFGDNEPFPKNPSHFDDLTFM